MRLQLVASNNTVPLASCLYTRPLREVALSSPLRRSTYVFHCMQSVLPERKKERKKQIVRHGRGLRAIWVYSPEGTSWPL